MTHGSNRQEVEKLTEGFAKQTVEAKLGIALLALGFFLQALSYVPGTSGLDGWREMVVGA